MGDMATRVETLPKWTPAIAVGDAGLDREHQALFDQIATVGGLIGRGVDLPLLEALDRLVATLERHCQGEERFFSDTAYPHTAAHKVEHRVLRHLARHIRLSANLVPDPDLFRLSLRHFLQALIEHIIEIDQGYRPYLER